MRYLPTVPLELARPSGNRRDAESNSRRAVSAPFALRTMARARCACSRPSLSQYRTRVTRPASLVSILNTVDSGRISQRPVASANGIMDASEEDLAPTSHPKKKQKPQWMQLVRLL